MKISGSKAMVMFGVRQESDLIKNSGQLVPGYCYLLKEKGEGSDLPLEPGFPFQIPDGQPPISLKPGDAVYKNSPSRFCKTSASLSATQGTIDVGDDCTPGAKILDGITSVSGSIAGFFDYNSSGEMDDISAIIVNRFFDVVTEKIGDGGETEYEYSPKDDTPMYLRVCLNSNAEVGKTENWLEIPIIISSLSMNFGNTDAQNKDLSWEQGDGPVVLYKRIKTSV